MLTLTCSGFSFSLFGSSLCLFGLGLFFLFSLFLCFSGSFDFPSAGFAFCSGLWRFAIQPYFPNSFSIFFLYTLLYCLKFRVNFTLFRVSLALFLFNCLSPLFPQCITLFKRTSAIEAILNNYDTVVFYRIHLFVICNKAY